VSLEQEKDKDRDNDAMRRVPCAGSKTKELIV